MPRRRIPRTSSVPFARDRPDSPEASVDERTVLLVTNPRRPEAAEVAREFPLRSRAPVQLTAKRAGRC